MSYLVDQLWTFLQYFWSVFTFWLLWQVCDWGLSVLKVKLRKPWTFDSKDDNGGNSSAETLQNDDQS